MNRYHDHASDKSLIKGKKLAVIGHGTQGLAQDYNLTHLGDEVVVRIRERHSSPVQA